MTTETKISEVLKSFNERFPKCTNSICADEDCWEDGPGRKPIKDFLKSSLILVVEDIKEKIPELIEVSVNSWISCPDDDKEIIADEDVVPLKKHLIKNILEILEDYKK
jgi:hypothetical protein